MIEYFDEDEYLEDIYGDEIKVGDYYYIFYDEVTHSYLIIKKENVFQFAKDELDLREMER